MIIPLYILHEIKKELSSPIERKRIEKKEEEFINKFFSKKYNFQLKKVMKNA